MLANVVVLLSFVRSGRLVAPKCNPIQMMFALRVCGDAAEAPKGHVLFERVALRR